MARISILLATPPGFNPGMTATELGLLAFLRRHTLLPQAKIYRFLQLRDRLSALAPVDVEAVERRGEVGIASASAIDDYHAMIAGDVVLYWADFLHMAQYLRALKSVATRHYGEAQAAAVQHLPEKLFLLAEADDAVLGRTLSFGTTLLFNTAPDETDTAYGCHLRRFLRGARDIWVRDAFSAARVAHLRGDYGRSHFGVDAALLFRREDLDAVQPPDADAAGKILVFFGREPSTRAAMMALAERLGQAKGAALAWLPWGDERSFPHIEDRPVALALDAAATATAMLAAVASARAVVTDTYHLAVMAWNFGIPAVCCFPGSSAAPSDVSSGAAFNWRDKREVFFSQYDALAYLVRPEELVDPVRFERRAVALEAALDDRLLIATIAGTIRAHAEACEAQLAASVATLLAAA